MKITQVICLLLGLLFTTEILQAQTTSAPTPPARMRRNFAQVDANAPATKYDYHDAFAPFFYSKNGNEYRAAYRKTRAKVLAK
jgi:hypothetical protein